MGGGCLGSFLPEMLKCHIFCSFKLDNNGRATKCGEIYCYVCMFANNGRATTFLVGVY